MAQGHTATHQNPYKLLLLETVLHVLAAGLVYLRLPTMPDSKLRYGFLAIFGGAIVLRVSANLISTSDRSVTGNYGKSAGVAQVITTLLLGLAWGILLPLLTSFNALHTPFFSILPVATSISALAVFTGSALNTHLLLVFVVSAYFPPMGSLAMESQYDALVMWGLIAVAFLGLSLSSSGLEDLIERFLQISRGNSELVKNLARTRDEAIAAQKAAEQARKTIQDEIAERKKAEEKTNESERELSRILDDMVDTYFLVGPDEKLQRVSPSIECLLGYSVDECIHKPWSNLFFDDNGHTAFANAIAGAFGALNNYEVRLRHREGHEVWVTLNAHYRENRHGDRESFEGIARDTSATRKAKETLFQEKELWRVTLESIGDGVITTDTGGQVNYLNAVAEKMTGWTNQLANHQPLAKVMNLRTESGDTAVKIPMQAWLEDGLKASLDHPAVLIHHSGTTEAAIELNGSPIKDSQNQTIGSVMVFHDVTKLRALTMQLSHQATHDALTGLINRVAFDARVEQAVHSAGKSEKQHTLCYIDLDQFKIVNDTCGHPAGDELLIQITRLLRSCLRESDVLARLGGDEFGVLLLGCPLKKAEAVTETLRQTVEAFRFRYDNKEFRVGTSIGVVPIPDNKTTLTDLMKAVDSACYVAKERGRNRIHVSKPDDKEIAQHHGQMQWMQRIQHAVEQDEFVLYAQPITAIEGALEQRKHAELLLRMVENKGTGKEQIILPDAFLPAAQRYHLMPLIDRWVLDNALKKLASNDAYMERLATCTINLSGQSLTDLKLYDYIIKLLKETKVDPRRICFEITESAVIANMEIAQQFVNGMRKIGCRFALDDFGSGLSTFDYLKQLNVDYVKLDGSLIRDVATSRVSQAMVHAVNYVAHVMGMKTIAEFVESDAILQTLRNLSVDYAQGYAIGKPQPLDCYSPDLVGDSLSERRSTGTNPR
jgi:diguanylate cyclase (GGDEF)-like protein/PAS domain S-box-containing protein